MAESDSEFSGAEEMNVEEGASANIVLQSQLENSNLSMPSRVSAAQDKKEPKKKGKLPHRGIPVLNKATVDLNTYDYQRLLEQQKPGKYTRTTLLNYSSNLNSLKNNKGKTNKSSASAVLDVDERFFKFQEHLNLKIAEERERSEQEEMKNCTFQPNASQNCDSRTQRSFARCYKDMMRHQKLKEEKMARLREEDRKLKGQDKNKFRPDLCKNSLKIIATRSIVTGSTHERLYQMYKGTSKNNTLMSTTKYVEDSCAFTPQVNKKSKELVRRQPIQEILYKDAMRRQAKQGAPSNFEQAAPSSNSIRILIKTFLCEYEKHSKSYDLLNNGLVSYSVFTSMFASMNFLSVEVNKANEETILLLELWHSLQRKDNFVHLTDLKVAMMGIMGYHESWMNGPSSQRFLLDKQKTKKFHEKFKILFENRGSTTFKKAPQNSSVLSVHLEKNRDKSFVKIEDKLIEQGREREESLNKLRNIYKAQDMNKCTFQPVIRSSSIGQVNEENQINSLSKEYRRMNKDRRSTFNSLYLLAHLAKGKKDQLLQERREIQEKERQRECTFAPELATRTAELKPKQNTRRKRSGTEFPSAMWESDRHTDLPEIKEEFKKSQSIQEQSVSSLEVSEFRIDATDKGLPVAISVEVGLKNKPSETDSPPNALKGKSSARK